MSSLLITNGHLVTLDEANRFIVNGSVYIEDGRIIESVIRRPSGVRQTIALTPAAVLSCRA